jgi:hypothetical protein
VRRHSSCLYLRTVYREAHYKWLMKGGRALNEERAARSRTSDGYQSIVAAARGLRRYLPRPHRGACCVPTRGGIASDPTERFLLCTLAAALPPGLRAVAVARRCTDLDVPAIHPSLVPNHKNYKSWCWIKIACVRQFTNCARMLPSCSRRLTPAMCSSHTIPLRRTIATRWRRPRQWHTKRATTFSRRSTPS